MWKKSAVGKLYKPKARPHIEVVEPGGSLNNVRLMDHAVAHFILLFPNGGDWESFPRRYGITTIGTEIDRGQV